MIDRAFGQVGLVVLIAASGLSSGVFLQERLAHADCTKFSNSNFRGDYGILELGSVEGFDFIEVSQIHADGAGKLTIDAIGNFGGKADIKVVLQCTYDVRSNGMGHMICHDPTGEETAADFVIDDGDKEIKFITTPSPAGYTYLRATRQ